jgi:hypothetical protein
MKFPFISSNIRAKPAYGVYISQLIRYSRACGFGPDFVDIDNDNEATEPRVPIG